MATFDLTDNPIPTPQFPQTILHSMTIEARIADDTDLDTFQTMNPLLWE
jgi:hypothetical protein